MKATHWNIGKWETIQGSKNKIILGVVCIMKHHLSKVVPLCGEEKKNDLGKFRSISESFSHSESLFTLEQTVKIWKLKQNIFRMTTGKHFYYSE